MDWRVSVIGEENILGKGLEWGCVDGGVGSELCS